MGPPPPPEAVASFRRAFGNAHRPGLQRGKAPPPQRVSPTPRPNASQHGNSQRKALWQSAGHVFDRAKKVPAEISDRRRHVHELPPRASGVCVVGVPFPVISHPSRLTLGWRAAAAAARESPQAVALVSPPVPASATPLPPATTSGCATTAD